MGAPQAALTSLAVLLVFCTEALNSQNYGEIGYNSRQNGYSPIQSPQEFLDYLDNRTHSLSSTFSPPDLPAQDGKEDHSGYERDDHAAVPFRPRPQGNNGPLANQYAPHNSPGIPPSSNGYPPGIPSSSNGYPPGIPSSSNGYPPGIPPSSNGYPPGPYSGLPGGALGPGSDRVFSKIPTSVSKYVSGDYCWEPLVACDTANTVLYCLKGRCTCPTEWTLAPGNIPLNTVWHPTYKRCMSLIGSGCHTSPTSSSQGYVYCQPGVECVPHSTYSEVGTCGSTSIFSCSLLIAALSLIHLFLLSLRCSSSSMYA